MMQPHSPFGYVSQNQQVQGASNTQQTRPGNFSDQSGHQHSNNGAHEQVTKYHQRYNQVSHSGRQGTTSSKHVQPIGSTKNEASISQTIHKDPVLSDLESITVLGESQLTKITNGFSTVLGNGGFGTVYFGTLHDGRKVAVNVPIRATETDTTDFKNELRIQSRIKHKNVIKLLGYCLEGAAPKLVYEFAANGNLYDKLHGINSRIPMSLDVRIRIALECAEALAYIHSSTDKCILHGDVKSANILLDDNFIAKVSDFGLSRLLSVGSNTMYTKNVRGSFGYIDPMFIKEGILTQKSDVYSFGVVLVELITRKKARDESGKDLEPCFLSCFSKK